MAHLGSGGAPSDGRPSPPTSRAVRTQVDRTGSTPKSADSALWRACYLLIDSGACELEPGNRRTAGRGQIDTFQRADTQQRAGRQLSVRDDRAERGRGAVARPAAGRARENVSLRQD